PVFHPVHVVAATAIERARLIAADDVLHTRGHYDLRASNTCRTDAVYDDFDLFHLLANVLERVDQCGKDDNSGTVLIVVKHWNVEFFSESFLDLETARRRDVFEVDTAKHNRDCFHCAHDLVGIFCVETDRKRIDAGEFLEQHRLPFHHRQCRRWSNISETENR